MSHELAGRIALVTGGSRGIGRACCQRLAEAGATVVVNYCTNEAAALETLQQIVDAGGKAVQVQADVSLESDVHRMVGWVEQEVGPIDLLVNNAGVFDFLPHDQTTPEIWQRAIDVNLTGAYYVTWAVKAGMIERQFGRIVNVASIAALRARSMAIAYSVSKAGMVAMTKGLAEALAGANVRVNAVAPGLIETEIHQSIDRDRLDQIVASSPIQRMGTPEEISEFVLFLLSERSSFMTGQTLVASGGRVMLP